MNGILVDIIPMIVGDTAPLIDKLDSRIDQYAMISSSDVWRNYDFFQHKAVGECVIDAVGERSALRRGEAVTIHLELRICRLGSFVATPSV